MSEFNQLHNEDYTIDDTDSLRSYITKTFTKMAIGLIITAAVAFGCYKGLGDNFNGFLGQALIQSGTAIIFIMLGLAVTQLVVCVILSVRISKMSITTANVLFFLYCVLTGLTFSILPYVYGVTDMFIAFGFTAVLFISCSVIGYTTKIDLTKFTGLIIGGLFTLVLITVVGLFINLPFLTMVICYAGVGIFLVLTAWDMQKLKKAYYELSAEPELREKYSVFSAFGLYLDFINIFLYILKILGRSRRR